MCIRDRYRGNLSDYLAKNEFTLKYRRISYNEKMKEALQDCYIEISNAKNPKLVMKCKEDVDDPIVMQYKKETGHWSVSREESMKKIYQKSVVVFDGFMILEICEQVVSKE